LDVKELAVLLNRSNEGDSGAREQVLELVYKDLHRMAKRHAYKAGETMRPTALVNEAYLKMFSGQGRIQNRNNLFALAALAMRQVILNNAEKVNTKKRGGDQMKLTLQEWDQPAGIETDYEALNEALDELEKVEPRYAQILGLCYFAGFKNKEIADVLEVSESTVYKDLRLAKAWLKRKLKKSAAIKSE